jgi:simple sugar transport system permease protein
VKETKSDKPSKQSGGTQGQATIASVWQTVVYPLLAIVTALLCGALVILWAGGDVIAAYGALLRGSLGSPAEITEGIRVYVTTGETHALFRSIYPVTESLVTATPYILAGLAVALGFRCGLFNIGAEGQYLIGALAAAWVGYSFSLPAFVHLPLALLAGATAGALWAAIPGYLKAKFGAHEVVNTIMMNWIAFRLSDWLLKGPMKASGFRPVTPTIHATAELPRFFPEPLRFNWGFFLALAMAVIVYWLIFKSTTGFDIRVVGANPDAGKYAGVNIFRNIILAMTLSGALAGLAGTTQVLGVDHWVGQGFSAGYGFDSIAVALLGKSHPLGVVLSALLFGALRSGATEMQSMAGIPIDIISIIQGLVIIFVAAPEIIRRLYHLPVQAQDEMVLTRGWGK